MARRGGRGTGRGTGEWDTQGRDTGRRGRRGSDDLPETTGSWSLGDYEWPPGDQTGPPWEQPDWEGPPPPAPGRPLGDLSAGHPSGPLPRVRGGHPSGPLPRAGGGRPAMPGPSGRRPGSADAGRGDAGRGYDTGAFDADRYDTGSFRSGPYDTGSFRSGPYDTGSYDAVRPGAGPYDTGSIPAGGYDGGYDTGSWDGADYDEADEEPVTRMGFAGGGLGYAGHTAAAGYADDDFDADGEWYEDADEAQDWADDEDDEDFLPGLSGGRSRDAGGGSARDGGKRKPARKRGRRAVKVLLLVFLIILLAGGAGAYRYVWPKLFPPDYSGMGTGSVRVSIAAGDTATTVGDILVRDGVVASSRAFHNAAVSNPRGSALQPGVYLLHKHMQASLALQMLLSPSSKVLIKVTIREGLRLADIIKLLGQKTGNLSGYQKAASDPAALGLPSYAKGGLEGYLFPDTYDILPGESPVKVLTGMVSEFKQQVASLGLTKRSAYLGVSPHDLIVVASLVQAEGKRPQDLGKIARVIYNRLYVAHMALGFDTTVMYAMSLKGIYVHKELTDAQTKFKSPYNTYQHLGLPPGPIDSPGVRALHAALYPTKGDWTYFLTVNPNTGLTKFTNSSAQFYAWQQGLKK